MMTFVSASVFDTVENWFSKLWIDANTLSAVIEWAKDIPAKFGALHPVLSLVFGLFGVFLTLKIIIHLL